MLKMFKYNQDLLENGVYVNPVVPPATPVATIRTSLMATHTSKDISEAVEILEHLAYKNRILKKNGKNGKNGKNDKK